MNNIIIRKFELDDINEVYELLNELYSNKINYDVFSKIYKLKLETNTSYNIVAILENKIVGVLVSEINTKLHRKKI